MQSLFLVLSRVSTHVWYGWYALLAILRFGSAVSSICQVKHLNPLACSSLSRRLLLVLEASGFQRRPLLSLKVHHGDECRRQEPRPHQDTPGGIVRSTAAARAAALLANSFCTFGGEMFWFQEGQIWMSLLRLLQHVRPRCILPCLCMGRGCRPFSILSPRRQNHKSGNGLTEAS